MGTRNLTMVISGGKTRIAQYGQWDGYPEGQGVTALDFLHTHDLGIFKLKLLKCKFINKRKEREINKFMESIGCKDGWMNMDQSAKYHAKYPLLTRDNGAGILDLIARSTERFIWIHDQSEFAGDGLFCEWAYVIDFDKGTFEVYKGFGKEPLTEEDRFFYLTQKDEKYSPVKLLKSFSLNELPTKEAFLEELGKLQEQEDEE